MRVARIALSGMLLLALSGGDLRAQAEGKRKVTSPAFTDYGSGFGKTLSSVMAGLEVTGGISAGWFFTSRPGEGFSSSEWLLFNLLVEISPKDKTAPLGFTAAFGETSTPSLLGSPENANGDQLGTVLVFLHNSFFCLLFMTVHRPQRVHPDAGKLGNPGDISIFQSAAIFLI